MLLWSFLKQKETLQFSQDRDYKSEFLYVWQVTTVVIPTLAKGKITCLKGKKKTHHHQLCGQKPSLHVKLGSEQAGVVAGVHICPDSNSSSLSVSLRSGACIYGTKQSIHLSSTILVDFMWSQTPGVPLARIFLNLDTPLGKAEHFAKASPHLSPCQVISQWDSNYSDWHVLRSCVKDIYLVYKQKIPQWISQKEIISFTVHFSNPRLCQQAPTEPTETHWLQNEQFKNHFVYHAAISLWFYFC